MTPPEVEEEPKDAKSSVRQFFTELPVLIVIALAVALLIKAFVVQAFFIQMQSMEPTLHPSERVLVSKFSYRFGDPERGDVVILHDPGSPCRQNAPSCDRSFGARTANFVKELFGLPQGDDKDLVKRIVGLPGEELSMQDGNLYINGELVELPSTSEEGPQLDDTDVEAMMIPDDSYYVLGDNRDESSDSRAFGPVPRRDLIGRAFVLIWPVTRFGGL
jgi:signal peptidase I